MTSSPDSMRSQLNAAVAGVEPGLTAANELCAVCVDLLDLDGAAVSLVFGGETRGTFGSSSQYSRRLDEYQFTFGEGPCLDAVASREVVLVPDLNARDEQRWPAFVRAVLGDGINGVFALPIMMTSVCVGALDLFREAPGPLLDDQLAGALLAAELASLPLLDQLSTDAFDVQGGMDLGTETSLENGADGALEDRPMSEGEEAWERLAEMDRIEVYQATGMLISQLDVDAPTALVRLRAHAIATGQTASQVARAIVERRLVLERDDLDGGLDDPDGTEGRH